MRVRWLGQPRSVHGVLRLTGTEWDDLGQEFVDNGMCAEVVETSPKFGPTPVKGRTAAASAEED